MNMITIANNKLENKPSTPVKAYCPCCNKEWSVQDSEGGKLLQYIKCESNDKLYLIGVKRRKL